MYQSFQLPDLRFPIEILLCLAVITLAIIVNYLSASRRIWKKGCAEMEEGWRNEKDQRHDCEIVYQQVLHTSIERGTEIITLTKERDKLADDLRFANTQIEIKEAEIGRLTEENNKCSEYHKEQNATITQLKADLKTVRCALMKLTTKYNHLWDIIISDSQQKFNELVRKEKADRKARLTMKHKSQHR